MGWVDESGSNASVDPGSYILAAVVAEEARAGQLRESMLSLRLKGQRKVHWRNESGKRQSEIVQAVAGLPIEALVVVRHRLPAERPERRRRKCMERLVMELEGCTLLTLESRGPKDDSRDRELVDALRRRRAIPRGLRTAHVPGPSDPALWVADAVCGTITQARSGDRRRLDRLRAAVNVVIIET